MASLDQETTKLTIFDCASRCIRSFQQCLPAAASIHARESALVEDQLAKFSLWTANFKVFASGRESLDHRLREVLDIQDAIIGVLEALDYRIMSCTSILETCIPVALDKKLPTVDARLDSTLRDIAKQIALLYKFSNIIRRESRETSTPQAVTNFQVQDNEGDNLEPFLKEAFAHQVRDEFPGVGDIIQQRLVNTMFLRHKRILYRRYCYGKFTDRVGTDSAPVVRQQPSVRYEAAQHDDENLSTTTFTPRSVAQWVTETVALLPLAKFSRVSTASDLSPSRSTAMGDHGNIPFPPAPCGNIMRKYNELKKQRENGIYQYDESANPEATQKYKESLKNDWSEILEEAGGVDCPFCCSSLPVQDVVDENKWKLHIKNDIDPYVCLFEGCESPDELYSHSSIWLKHMSSHYMRWCCTSKSHIEFRCATKSEYMNHMNVAHPGKFTHAQLEILATRNARPISSMFKPCPLCGNEEIDGNRADHVAQHLLLLALKSLPSYEDHVKGQDGSECQTYDLLTADTRNAITNSQYLENSAASIHNDAKIQSFFIHKNEDLPLNHFISIPQQDQGHTREQQRQLKRLDIPQYSTHSAHNNQPVVTHFQPTQMDWSTMYQSASPTTQLHSSPANSLSTTNINSPMTADSIFSYTTSLQDFDDTTRFNQEWPKATSLQDFGDVAQLSQERTKVSQRRNELSQILKDSFDWHGTILTDQGLPLFDRQRIELGDRSIASMDQWSDNPGELSQQQHTAQPGLVNDDDLYNMQGYSTEDSQSSQNDDRGYISNPAPDDQTASFNHQQSLAVEVTLDQMSAKLDSLYRSNSAYAHITKEYPPATQTLFMCPYAMKYPDRVNHVCFQRLASIPYVKQHLRRRHHDAISCPHQCQNRISSAVSQRSQPNATLSFGSGPCLQINKLRSDRSKTHKQQWERIYQILFPEANRIPDPYIGDMAIKQLRNFYKFMEDHGRQCLASMYAIKPTYPDPEIMYRMAFCTWLPRVFEWRFPPQGQQLLGGFLNQIKSALRDNYNNMQYPPGIASQDNSASLPRTLQAGQQDPFFSPVPQHDTILGQQPFYPVVPVRYPIRQQNPLQTSAEETSSDTHSDLPSHISNSTATIRPQMDMDCATPTPHERYSEYQSEMHDLLVDQCSPVYGSPSQFWTGSPLDMEDVEISQMGTWGFDF
ncbi:hypothetical protein V8C42DRAFT_304373 [Trichoderma barbatum]